MSTYADALHAQLGNMLGPMLAWPGVHFGPGLTPAIARAARVRAQSAREAVLLVYTDTVSSDFSDYAFLVTDAAVYVRAPFRRIEHWQLQRAAHPGPPPVFPLAEGPLTLDWKLESERAIAVLGTAWTAVLRTNQALGAPPPEPFEVPGPLAAHARSVFVSPNIRVGPTNMRSDGLIYDVIAALGMGLDPFAQEVPLAIIADPKDLSECVLVTDQRILGRTEKGHMTAHYGELTNVQPSGGLLGTTLVLHLQGRIQSLKFLALEDETKMLGRFLYDVCQAPPHARRAPPEAFDPSPDDPTGARTAAGTAAGTDPQLAVLFEAMQRAHERGELPPAVGRDLVERARLLHRMELYARGMYQNLWLSALSPQDLAFLCGRTLGPAMNVVMDPSGALQGDFKIDHQRPSAGTLGAAALSTAAGLAVGALFGIGWVSVPRGPSVTRVRATIHPAPWGSAFALSNDEHRGVKPLSAVAPSLFARLDEALSRGEQQLLLLRALYGWNPDANALLSLPAESVTARVRDLTGSATHMDVFRASAEA